MASEKMFNSFAIQELSEMTVKIVAFSNIRNFTSMTAEICSLRSFSVASVKRISNKCTQLRILKKCCANRKKHNHFGYCVNTLNI